MIIRDEHMEGMSYPEFIDKIKMKGEKLEHGLLELPDDKYAETAVISYTNYYYAGWVVLDTYIDKVYDEYFEVFGTYNMALNYYNNLEETLNGRRYE